MFIITLLFYFLFWFVPGMIGLIMNEIGKRKYKRGFCEDIEGVDILLVLVLGWLWLIPGLVSYFGVAEKINNFIDEAADRKDRKEKINGKK